MHNTIVALFWLTVYTAYTGGTCT